MNLTKLMRLLFFALIFIGLTDLRAQESGGSQVPTVSDFKLNFNSSLDSYYYQDPLSSAIGNQLFTSDGEININDYILGPSDLITVDIEGAKNIVLRALLINPQGDIVIPMLGSVNIANQTISEAQKTIDEASKALFKSPSSHITLERPRPLVIQVTGAVEYPGKHTVPAFSRVDVAIFGSIYRVDRASSVDNLRESNGTVELLNAGPLSLRNIKITHKDGSTEFADLVSYFKTGDLDKNPIVEYGDQIVINRLTAASPRISISGAVNNEQELEYSKNDTPSLLVDIAGGYKTQADTSKLYVFRKDQDGGINKIEVEQESWDSFNLQPNDRIIVPTIQGPNQSASAWVYGEVKIPGNFPIENGETTALQLLEFSGNLTKQALPSAAYLIRKGALENEIPNKFNSDLMKRTSDQVAQGFEYLDLETKVSQDKVYIDLTDQEQLSEVKIYDGDRLYIPRDEETVFVFGQINNPGYYPFTSSSQQAADYIRRAGGFALSADEGRIFIIKAGSGTWYRPSETNLESGDRIFVDRIPFDELNAQRTYKVQREQIKNTRIQLIMTALTTITSIITTYVAITR